MHKIFFILLLGLILSDISFSQNDPDRKGNRKIKPQFDDGEISGFIFDRQSNTPLEAVAIQLIKVRDSSLYKGMETDINGYFKMTGISQGRYSLSVFLTGYNRNIRSIMMNDPENKNINLDTIFLSTGTVTDEIEVQTDRPFLELKGDKKVFNVEDNMNVTGGTALDVLKNLPSVTVDIDDNVSLRGGQQIKFYINGRPVTGTISRVLDQLPADQLSAVEVITNPSAKYEAESSTGVINLVMKKYDDTGFNGELKLSAGTGDKYGSGLSLNYKTNKYKLTGSYDYRLRNMNYNGTIERYNFFETEDAYTNQTSDGNFKRYGNNFAAELEYMLSQSDILNFSGKYGSGDRDRGDTDNILVYDENNNLNQSSITNNYETEDNEEYSIGLNYNKVFQSKKKSLSGEVSFSYDKEYENETQITQYLLPLNTPDLNSITNAKELEKELNVQTDFESPLGKNIQFQTGLKYNYSNTNADNFYYNQNDSTGVYVIDSALTDQFIFAENVGGAYVMIGKNEGDFTYNLGLRGEYWNYNIDQYAINVNTSRNQFDIFPSATVTQKLGMTEEISLSYSRRVSRPRYRELSPIVRVFSPIFYRQGNPDLGSEYINSFELNFAKFFNSFSVIPSAFYRLTNDKITFYSELIDSNITLSTSINADNEISYGGELLVNGALSKDFSLNGSISYFTQEINSDTLATVSNNTFAGRLFASYNLPLDMAVQLTYFYSGKRITSQGEFEPVSTIDLGFRKDFMNKKISLNLNASDLFDWRKWKGTTNADTYYQDFTRQRESQVVSMTLTYKFGTEEKGRKRNKKRGSPGDNDDGGGDDGF